MESMDFRNMKDKIEYYKFKAKEKTNQVVQKAKEHPQVALFVGSTAIGGISFVGKRIFKAVDTAKMEKLVECRHYDRRTDTYWFSKRPLKSSEKLMLDKLYSEGKSKGEILQDMGLLRK